MTKGQKTVVGVLAAIGAVFGLRKLAEAAPPPIIPLDEPLPPECRNGDTVCHGEDLYACVNGRWVLAVAQSEACIMREPRPVPIPPEPELWTCVRCGAEFDKKSALKAHLDTWCESNCPLQTLYCWDCGEVFEVQQSCTPVIDDESRMGDVALAGIVWSCPKCGSTNLHEEPYVEPGLAWVCPVCEASFATIEELAVHTSGHTQIELELKAGWNTVSISISPTNTSPAAVFPGAEVVYIWNSETKSYEQPTSISRNVEYQVAYMSDIVITVIGRSNYYGLVADAAVNRGTASEADVQTCHDWWLEGKMEMSDVLTVVNVQLHPA